MASVWLALSTQHARLVAIKTIRAEHAGDIRFREMFLDEARISAEIDDPNVARALDRGDDNGVLYLVMEWIDGDSLSTLLKSLARRGAPFPLAIGMRIVADVCSGLHAIHELGLVHRDVSPQNILIASNGVAKIIDFGIAQAQNRIRDDSTIGILKGKLHYMAPEQASGNVVDRRADLWGAGAVLYRLIQGSPPFRGPNQLATLHILTSGRPPKALPAESPAAVQSVVSRALAHDPRARYGSAADLRRAIEAAMADSAITATTDDVARFRAEHLAPSSDARP